MELKRPQTVLPSGGSGVPKRDRFLIENRRKLVRRSENRFFVSPQLYNTFHLYLTFPHPLMEWKMIFSATFLKRYSIISPPPSPARPPFRENCMQVGGRKTYATNGKPRVENGYYVTRLVNVRFIAFKKRSVFIYIYLQHCFDSILKGIYGVLYPLFDVMCEWWVWCLFLKCYLDYQ